MYATKAIRFTQNGRVFYVTAIPASKLVELTKVDVWDPEKPKEGYQRAPSMARKRSIARYIKRDDAILPVGGLVNARPEDKEEKESRYGQVLHFEPESGDGNISFGTLTIPDEAVPLYIVDMQHRIGGFEVALEENPELGDFPLVVTIADGLSRLEEIDQFDLINTTQKKIRTDLARRLKVIQAGNLDVRLELDKKGKLWEAKGPVIADILNKSQGVWFRKILPPNMTRKDMPTMIIRETSFVTSLKPILQTPYFLRQKEEHSAELIRRYWEALRMVFPEPFENPKEHLIQKTPGVFSLHKIAPEVFEIAREKSEITVDGLFEILKNLRNIEDGSYFWNKENEEGAVQYGSMKGFAILASILRQYLPTVDVR